MNKSNYIAIVLSILVVLLGISALSTYKEMKAIESEKRIIEDEIDKVQKEKEVLREQKEQEEQDKLDLIKELENKDEELIKIKKRLEARATLPKPTRGGESVSISNKDKDGRKYRVETLTVTAYAPFDNASGMCHDGNPNKTSTGSKPMHGTVAVNPKRFPYGTEFYIEGYGWGKALDTGGAMRQNSGKIDVFMQTSKQSREWGVRKVNVRVYE